MTRRPPDGPVWTLAGGVLGLADAGGPPPGLVAWYHPGGWWATPEAWPWNRDGSPAEFDDPADRRVDSGGDDGW